MSLKVMGPRIKNCPNCGEDLFESTSEYDENGKICARSKECADCDLVFKKRKIRKGVWTPWKMGTIDEHLDAELDRM